MQPSISMVGHQSGHLLLRLMSMEVRDGGRERGWEREGGRKSERKRLRSLGTGKEGKVYLSILFKINRGIASLYFVYSQDLISIVHTTSK